MKKLSVTFLLSIIILQTFSSFVIRADYFLNKEFIAKVLCINKNKPATHCNGKCYLAKQLKQQENQDQQTPSFKKDKFEIHHFFLPKQFSFTSLQSTAKTKHRLSNDGAIISYPGSVFHPPNV